MRGPFPDKPKGIPRILPRMRFAFTICLLFFTFGMGIQCGRGGDGQIVSLHNESTKILQPLVEFEGTLYPKRFLGVEGELFGHHAVTWKGGRSARLALIEADVPDRWVADELAKKGLIFNQLPSQKELPISPIN